MKPAAAAARRSRLCVDRLAAALDQAVGVQQQAGAGLERVRARAERRGRRRAAAERCRRRGIESHRRARSAAAGGGRRSRGAARRSRGRAGRAGRWPSALGAVGEAVEPPQHLVGRCAVEHAGAQAAAHLAHQRRGGDALAGHVADREREVARVEPTASYQSPPTSPAAGSKWALRRGRGPRAGAPAAARAGASRRSRARARAAARARSPAPRARRPASAGAGRPR